MTCSVVLYIFYGFSGQEGECECIRSWIGTCRSATAELTFESIGRQRKTLFRKVFPSGSTPDAAEVPLCFRRLDVFFIWASVGFCGDIWVK